MITKRKRFSDEPFIKRIALIKKFCRSGRACQYNEFAEWLRQNDYDVGAYDKYNFNREYPFIEYTQSELKAHLDDPGMEWARDKIESISESQKITLTFGQLKRLVKESSSVNEMLGPPWYTNPPEYYEREGPDFEEWASKIEKFADKLDYNYDGSKKGEDPGEFNDLCYRIENSYDEKLRRYTTIKEEDREAALEDIAVLLDEERGLPYLIREIEEHDSEIKGWTNRKLDHSDYVEKLKSIIEMIKSIRDNIDKPLPDNVNDMIFELNDGAPCKSEWEDWY